MLRGANSKCYSCCLLLLLLSNSCSHTSLVGAVTTVPPAHHDDDHHEDVHHHSDERHHDDDEEHHHDDNDDEVHLEDFWEDLHEKFNFSSNHPMQFEQFERLLERLHIGKVRYVSDIDVHTEESPDHMTGHEGHDSHEEDGHGRRRRRNVDGHEDHGHEDEHSDHDEGSDGHEGESHIKKCYNGSELISILDIDASDGLNQTELYTLCPALIQQASSSVCVIVEKLPEKPGKTHAEKMASLGWGVLAVFIVSIGAVCGIIILPFMKNIFHYVMMGLIGLSTSTMASDALLHLIPQAVELHEQHGAEQSQSEDSHEHEDELRYVYKMAMVLLAMWGFYLLQVLFNTLTQKAESEVHPHSHTHIGEDANHGHSHIPDINLLDRSRPASLRRLGSGRRPIKNGDAVQNSAASVKTLQIHTGAINESCTDDDNKRLRTRSDTLTLPQSEGDISLRIVENGNNTTPTKSIPTIKVVTDEETSNTMTSSQSSVEDLKKDKSVFNRDMSNRSFSGQSNKPIIFGLNSLALMILLGDGVHNFVDGMVMGAAFAGDTISGVSTTLAVVFHEIPHELGDFAVLLACGVQWKTALLLNYVSALTSFVGYFIGFFIAQQEETRLWIFAITAGMFLYIALSEMLPELTNLPRDGRALKTFFSINLGLLVGFALMLVIALYEDKIKIG